jgi:hypothetical protein
VITFVALWVTASCGQSQLDRRHVREYLRLAVALGERDPDSIDFYYGPPGWVADIRRNPPGLSEIRRSALQLERDLGNDKRPRFARLERQVGALAERANQLLGVKQSFDQETSAYFGLTAGEVDSGAMDQVRTQIDRLLGSGGPAAERFAAFDEKFLVPPDRLPAVMARAMKGCRDRTLEHLLLPAGETVTVEYVHNKPWSAFSHYQGKFHSLIEVNSDLPLTVDRVLQLACHEGYPGHHAFNTLQEWHFVKEQHWEEWMVQPAFSPQSLVSEGLATFAADVAFPEPERLSFERDILFPLAGLHPEDAALYDRIERLIDQLQSAEPGIARAYLDGRLEWARAAEALERQVLMTHPEQTLKYMNEYRNYVITYTLGRDLVARQVHNWHQYEQLMTDPDAAEVIRGSNTAGTMER